MTPIVRFYTSESGNWFTAFFPRVMGEEQDGEIRIQFSGMTLEHSTGDDSRDPLPNAHKVELSFTPEEWAAFKAYGDSLMKTVS